MAGGPRSARVQAKAPFGQWYTMIFLAALRHDRIDASGVFAGPVNAEIIRTYVKQAPSILRLIAALDFAWRDARLGSRTMARRS